MQKCILWGWEVSLSVICANLFIDIHGTATVFQSTVFFHLLVDCMMEKQLLQVWKEKTIFTVNSSEYYVSGISFQNVFKF